MASLKIFLGLLEDGLLGQITDKGKKQLAVAKNEASRLIRLTADLLDIARLETGNMKLQKIECELDVVMVQSLDAVQQSAEAKNITLNCEPSNLRVPADPDRIIQVLVNFLSNAIKYSPEGKQVSIAATKDNDFACISVTDQGRGIPADQLNYVFERFRQVRDDDSSKGSGLGLAICRLIAEAHGGTTSATSTEGEGSRFWLKLPVC